MEDNFSRNNPSQKIEWLPLLAVGVLSSLLTAGLIWATVAGRGGSIVTNEQRVVEEESATIEAVEKVLPSVVAIVSSENVQNFFGNTFEQRGGGTGFIISADGLIATNRHVVESENAKYTVITSDGETYDATVVARDPLADLAIVKIPARNLTVAELGDSDELVLGQKVIAVGNALGEFQNTVTTGVVSGIGRVIVAGDGSGSSERLEGVIQTDAAINPGNSGGPLTNMAGQVIGINTAVSLQGQLIGFAIPINNVKSVLETVITQGEIIRPRLGVRYILITKEFAQLNDMDIEEGALVARGDNPGEVAVQPGGPGDVAGIEEGDILVSINGEKITENKSLSAILQKFKPNDEVEVELIRDGQSQTVRVKLGKL